MSKEARWVYVDPDRWFDDAGELEREERLRASILTALSNVYGPRVHGPELATQAEGEADDADLASGGSSFAMTLAEVADYFGCSVETIRKIEDKAFRKLRALRVGPYDEQRAVLRELWDGTTFRRVRTSAEDIDRAIWRAKYGSERRW